MTPYNAHEWVQGRVCDYHRRHAGLWGVLPLFGVLPTESLGTGQGGHAWAELQPNGRWLQLESTYGPNWGEGAAQLRAHTGALFSYYAITAIPLWGEVAFQRPLLLS